MMGRVLIAVIVAVLFMQFTVSQDACTNAINQYAANIASCINPPTNICSGQCRTYIDNVLNNCAPEVSY